MRRGIDLLANRGLVTERAISSRILVEGCMLGTFTGAKLGSYMTATKTDFVNAHYVENEADRVELIKDYAVAFLAALKVATREPTEPEPALGDLSGRLLVFERRMAELKARG